MYVIMRRYIFQIFKKFWSEHSSVYKGIHTSVNIQRRSYMFITRSTRITPRLYDGKLLRKQFFTSELPNYFRIIKLLNTNIEEVFLLYDLDSDVFRMFWPHTDVLSFTKGLKLWTSIKLQQRNRESNPRTYVADYYTYTYKITMTSLYVIAFSTYF